MSIILIGLYIYITVKAYLVYSNKFSFIRSSKYEFLEILALSLGFGFIFNIIYPTNPEEQNFIIDKSILWIAFISSLLMLGVGIGVRFVSEVLKKYLIEESIVSDKIRIIHDFYSQIWIIINLGFLAFLLSIIELSKLNSSRLSIVEMIILYSLSLVLGFLYSLYNKSKKEIHKVIFPLFILLSLCILLLTFENSAYYSYKSFPITNSFLVFSTSFLVATIYLIVLSKSNTKAEDNLDTNIEADITPEYKVRTSKDNTLVSPVSTEKSKSRSEGSILNYKPEEKLQNIIKINSEDASPDPVKKTSSKTIKSKPKKTPSSVKSQKIKPQKMPPVLSLTSLKSEY
jgi:hypothetical protein